MVDESYGYKISIFYGTKNGMVEPICAQFQKYQQANMTVKWFGKIMLE